MLTEPVFIRTACLIRFLPLTLSFSADQGFIQACAQIIIAHEQVLRPVQKTAASRFKVPIVQRMPQTHRDGRGRQGVL
jgi:hypothetical protein